LFWLQLIIKITVGSDTCNSFAEAIWEAMARAQIRAYSLASCEDGDRPAFCGSNPAFVGLMASCASCAFFALLLPNGITKSGKKERQASSKGQL
jgi:hypothetical protein